MEIELVGENAIQGNYTLHDMWVGEVESWKKIIWQYEGQARWKNRES
jgi:hypothetical protein